jgi:hypothetical protein
MSVLSPATFVCSHQAGIEAMTKRYVLKQAALIADHDQHITRRGQSCMPQQLGRVRLVPVTHLMVRSYICTDLQKR